MYLLRGKNEREHEIEVTYGYTPYIAATLEQPAEGGHVGFVSGPWPGRLGWLPQRLVRFFTAAGKA